MHILLVKMSSMGDVIHTLPALTDAMRAIPGLKIDWVVEPAFADIPAWHPAVNNIIPMPLRKWRKAIFKKETHTEIKTFFKTLREKKYDAIVDAQGLLKSALVSKCAHGKIAGFDKHSAREPLASFFYNEKYRVDKNQNAITRTRELFAKKFNYTFSGDPDFQIDSKKLQSIPFELAEKYAVFLHATTWATKHYPTQDWKKLLEKMREKNIVVYLPWGSDAEKKRAQQLAENFSNAIVLPKLAISQIASLLKNAVVTISVDTGLAHLSAALNTPTISLYGPTNPKRVGVMSQNATHLQSTHPDAPEVDIDPNMIWENCRRFL